MPSIKQEVLDRLSQRVVDAEKERDGMREQRDLDRNKAATARGLVDTLLETIAGRGPGRDYANDGMTPMGGYPPMHVTPPCATPILPSDAERAEQTIERLHRELMASECRLAEVRATARFVKEHLG